MKRKIKYAKALSVIIIIAVLATMILSLSVFPGCREVTATKITVVLDWVPNTNHT